MERVIDADERIYTGHCTDSARHTQQVDYFHYEHDLRTGDPCRHQAGGQRGGNPHGWPRCEVADRPAAAATQRPRREAILDALDGWLHESSLEAINIAEISKQAGVTRSAFYFYFENKGAAVAALMERMVDETFAVNDAFTSATDPPRPTHQRHARRPVRYLRTAPHMFRAMLDARGSSASVRDIWDNARESFVESVAEMIRTDRAAGVAPDGVDAEVMASVLLEFNDRLARTSHAGRTH